MLRMIKEILEDIERREIYFEKINQEAETFFREESEDDHFVSGPWKSKGKPAGFLNSDDEVIEQMGHDWRNLSGV